VAAECSEGSLNDEIADKPSTSDQSESDFGYCPVRDIRIVHRESDMSSATLREEELLDTLLLLYHIGVAPKFKQVRIFMIKYALIFTFTLLQVFVLGIWLILLVKGLCAA
jgi:Kip1 ubiquitination-promoting complex protein 1